MRLSISASFERKHVEPEKVNEMLQITPLLLIKAEEFLGFLIPKMSPLHSKNKFLIKRL